MIDEPLLRVSSLSKFYGARVGCEDISYPSSFAGLGVLSVLTVDLAEGVPAVDTDAVMTNGQTASPAPRRP